MKLHYGLVTEVRWGKGTDLSESSLFLVPEPTPEWPLGIEIAGSLLILEKKPAQASLFSNTS